MAHPQPADLRAQVSLEAAEGVVEAAGVREPHVPKEEAVAAVVRAAARGGGAARPRRDFGSRRRWQRWSGSAHQPPSASLWKTDWKADSRGIALPAGRKCRLTYAPAGT